ncbi:hypothetical protein Tco_0044261, partial [Tanacetum coccineum]
TQQYQAEIPQLDSSLAVPTFQQGEDPIDCINKVMAFLSVVASWFPPSNNQLRMGMTHGETVHSAKEAKKLCVVQGEVDVSRSTRSCCDSDVLSKVPYSDTYPNDMINQDVQEMPYSKQTHIDNYPDNEITSDSNIIPYSQYLQDS